MDSRYWRPIERKTFNVLMRSSSTQVLPHEEWPDLAQQMDDAGEKVKQVWGWPNGPDQAVIEVIREAENNSSFSWKRDRWYAAETTDGGTWITRKPDKEIENRGHHTSALPPWPLRDSGDSAGGT